MDTMEPEAAPAREEVAARERRVVLFQLLGVSSLGDTEGWVGVGKMFRRLM